MRWIVLLVAACSLETNHAPPDAPFACPADPPVGECDESDGTCAYPLGNGLTDSCACMFGQWRCNSCPADFRDPAAICQPGTGCDYEDWEHGCSCGCGSDGHWSCTPETIGSTCTIAP